MYAMQILDHMRRFADKPAEFWPGAKNADEAEAVEPMAYTLTVSPLDTEPPTADIRAVTLILQMKPIMIAVELVTIGRAVCGAIRADGIPDSNPSIKMDNQLTKQLFIHYSNRFDGRPIILKPLKDTKRDT